MFYGVWVPPGHCGIPYVSIVTDHIHIIRGKLKSAQTRWHTNTHDSKSMIRRFIHPHSFYSVYSKHRDRYICTGTHKYVIQINDSRNSNTSMDALTETESTTRHSGTRTGRQTYRLS